jgi:hypothetical protein
MYEQGEQWWTGKNPDLSNRALVIPLATSSSSKARSTGKGNYEFGLNKVYFLVFISVL